MLYHHGEVDTYSIRSLTSLKIQLSYFTDDPTKRVTAYITEEQKISLLTREFDKDHKEVFKIFRGLVKEISTNAAKYGMSSEQTKKCIIIKMDCSSEGKSDIQYVKLYNIVEVNDIDHVYEELQRQPISIEEHPIDWHSTSDKKDATVDLSSVIEIK